MYNPVIIIDRLLYKPHLCLPGFLMVFGNSVKDFLISFLYCISQTVNNCNACK